MSQDDDNGQGKDDEEERMATRPASLSEVHAQAVSALEDEEDDEEDNSDDDKDDDSDDDKKGGKGANDKDDDDAKDDDEEEEKSPPGPTVESDEDLKERREGLVTRYNELKEIEDDEDTAVKGEYKVAFTDAEGKTVYVRNEDQLPDDFEPASYKDFLKASRQLNDAQAKFNNELVKFKEDTDKLVGDEEAAKEAKALQESWNKEVEELKKTDDSLDDKKVQAVYKLMEEWNTKGKPLSSFEAAYAIYQAKNPGKEKDSAAERKKAAIAEKKRRGGQVMGGKSSSKRSGPIQAPISGTSLEAIHAKMVDSLEA